MAFFSENGKIRKMKKSAKIRIFSVRKKAVIVAFALLFLAASALVSAGGIKAAAKEKHFFTVVIDAGHGGIDGGVTGATTGIAESELNLSVAKFLKEDFAAAGFKVVMTRTSSAALYGYLGGSLKKRDMQNRKRVIEKASPDLVISIHMNKCPIPSRRGAQVFYRAGDERSIALAASVQDRLNNMEEASRDCISLVGDYYILNVSPCPAALVECGFLSNAEDEKLLVSESYRGKISCVIFKGAIDYLAGIGAYPKIG